MIKYLVIGDPVGHSRSPGMQNAAFEKYGLGTSYGMRRVRPEELPEFFEYARKNFRGVNLTIPHKTQAVTLSDELTARARICGSVNTLLIENGKITGDSTDGVGLERALRDNFYLAVKGNTFLFFGAGGAARATSIHFALCGAGEIIFVNRTIENALSIIRDIQKAVPEVKTRAILPSERENVRAALETCDALIQATSLGLKDDDPPPFDLDLLRSGMNLKIFDTIYRETPLQRRAAELGIPVAGGKEMLIHQGAASFEWWTQLPAPLDEMRKGFELPPGGIEV